MPEAIVGPEPLRLSFRVPKEDLFFLQVTLECCDREESIDEAFRAGDILDAFWAQNRAMLAEIVKSISARLDQRCDELLMLWQTAPTNPVTFTGAEMPRRQLDLS